MNWSSILLFKMFLYYVSTWPNNQPGISHQPYAVYNTNGTGVLQWWQWFSWPFTCNLNRHHRNTYIHAFDLVKRAFCNSKPLLFMTYIKYVMWSSKMSLMLGKHYQILDLVCLFVFFFFCFFLFVCLLVCLFVCWCVCLFVGVFVCLAKQSRAFCLLITKIKLMISKISTILSSWKQ